jgi:hypothetical protein
MYVLKKLYVGTYIDTEIYAHMHAAKSQMIFQFMIRLNSQLTICDAYQAIYVKDISHSTL